MAKVKRFKEFEREFTARDLHEYRENSFYFSDAVPEHEFWALRDEMRQWSHDEVRHAVYEADDARDWQIFRCALKGLSIHAKLAALEARWWDRVIKYYGAERNLVEQCRIDNYIGALKRAGQLDTNCNVVQPH